MWSSSFWQQRSLHAVARLLLLLAVGVLLCVTIGFTVASGQFARSDLLAIALYIGFAAFAWHPMTAAFVVMIISGVGVLFTGSGGDLLELAIALGLVAATCVPWVIAIHMVLLVALTMYLASQNSPLATGGAVGIAGVAVIAFLAGVAFRFVVVRETTLMAERALAVEDLERIAQEDRDRIADELHDGIAHDLTLVLFHARALPRQPDDAARQVSLDTIEKSADRALDGIQSLLSLMRDTRAEEQRHRASRYEGNVIAAALSLSALLRDAGILTSVSTPDAEIALASEDERVLVETAIEAVTNIIKHSPTSPSATLEISGHDDVIELVVTNTMPHDLVAQNRAAGGRGLNRARQRLRQRRGALESGTSGNTWVLRAIVPAGQRQAGERHSVGDPGS